MGALDRAVAASLPLIPRGIVGWAARPYIAGESVDDAVATVRGLMAEGAMATVDVLGEAVETEVAAEATVAAYVEVLDRIAAEGLDANVSVKLTGLGFDLDPALAEENLRRIVRRAEETGSFVRIDMEGSSMTDATLAIYERLRTDHDALGVVLQAMLKRTRRDVARLVPFDANVRVVKGIYVEPEEVAFQGRRIVQDNFMAVVEGLLSAGCTVAIATHDPELVERSVDAVGRLGVPRERYELQMLLGVAPGLRRELLAAGHRLRVYVPFGRAWYEYSVRRLRENPAMAGHVLRSFFAADRAG